MATIGSEAVKDVTNAALNVVAVFKGDPLRDQMHPAQLKALDELEQACRFLYGLLVKP